MAPDREPRSEFDPPSEPHSGVDADSEQVDSIVLVGGGDNGLLTALALERRLDDVDVSVIDDFDEPQPRVGKSTLTSFVEFLHEVLEISHERLVAEVPLGFKTTVYFEDWCGDSFHSPLGNSLPVVTPDAQVVHGGSPDPGAEFDEYRYRYEECEFSELYGELAEHPGKTPHLLKTDGPDLGIEEGLSDAAYHFNTRDFNELLRSVCEERGIDLVDDRIRTVETAHNRIERLESETTTYAADLYVDATGFDRTLMSELDNSFVEFDLPVDAAVKTSTNVSFSDIVSATVVTTGEAGWFWQIDTYDARDVGYVYSSSHLSREAAERELLETRDEEFDRGNLHHYRWESGILERPWVANCVAAGNAMAFAEPLHSFTLTAASSLAYRLANLLAKHGRINHEGLRNLYNRCARTKWDEIYEFQSLLYLYNSGETQFWEDARSIDPGVIEQYEAYQESGFAAPTERHTITRTGTDQNRYYLYFHVLRNLGVDSAFFESRDFDVDPEVVERVQEYTDGLPDQVDKFLTYEEFYHVLQLDFD